MGNEYNVIEKAVIKCACGGPVTLTSSAKVERIAGEKPLYLNDIIGAPVACPRSKNPCSVVASISMAGTEANVCSTSEYFLLRTTGFTTDKGRAVILSNPGQGTSKIAKVPSVENLVVQEDPPLEKVVREEKKKEYKRKYALYFLRKSEEIYKPLRPTREFIKADETFLAKDGLLDIKDNIHVHTFAYIYITQENKTIEYKVISKGTLYSEELKEIFFKNTQTNIEYNYIPLEKDSKVDISYSSIKLQDKADIQKLLRLSIDPKQPDQKDYFYFKDAQGINNNEITKEDLETQKKFKQSNDGKQKRLNILCIIEDILGEIEDMYVKYYNNYKLGLAYNHSIIEDIKKQNLYTYTIANMMDIFYIDEKQKNEAQKLKEIYQELVTLLLSDETFINILIKEDNLANILNDKNFKIAKNYVQEISYLNKDSLKDIVKYHVDKYSFITTNNYIYTNSQIKKRELRRHQTYKELSFYGTNQEFTKIQEDPRVLVSYLTFAIFFTNSYEEKLQKSDNFSKLSNLRKELYFLIKKMTPLPNIGSDNIRDIKKEIDKQKNSYKKIIEKKDCLIEEYAYLETTKKEQSFQQEDKTLKIKSEFIYSSKEKLYKETSLEKPSKILEKIEKKLQDEKLKKLLKIYENIKVEDDLAYVVSCMNIVYLLSAPRIGIDEESSKINLFKKELNHIYEFMINLTDKRIALSDEKKDTLIEEYQVSHTYLKMQIKLLDYAYLEDVELQKKAKNFLKKYEKKENKSYFVKLEDINDHLYDEEFKTKALIETMSQTLYTINGFSSNMIDILEKMKTGRISENYKNLQNFLDKIIEQRNHLRATSTLIAFITLGLYIYNKDKNFGNTMSAVSDIVNLTQVTTQKILKEVRQSKSAKDAEKILQKVFQDQRVQNISKTASRIANKVGIPLIVITGTYEAVKLFVNEDYDASIVSAIKTSLSIYLLISASFIYLLILEVIWYLYSHYVIDSDIEKYLIKSLLYKTIDFSIWKNLRGIEQEKKYQAPYLFETTNQNKELEAISNDGFNTPKKLVNFIGKNYKGNEKYFDISLRNELSFFKSSIFGYKIELLDETKRVKKLRNKYDVDVTLYEKTFVKIPNILYKDKDFNFIFVYDDKYQIIEKSTLILENDYYIYDLYNQDFTYLNELKTINHKKASIIVISSQVELKYDFIYSYKDLNYLFALNFEQSSFTPKDIEELDKLIEKKEETK